MASRYRLATVALAVCLAPAAATFAQTRPMFPVLELGSFGTGTAILAPVVDLKQPVITEATVTPNVIRAADETMRTVTVKVTAVDDIDRAPVCAVVTVTNSQSRRFGPDPSVEITGPLTLSLRASRRGSGSDRTYGIAVRCTDYSGNESNVALFVHVPRDS